MSQRDSGYERKALDLYETPRWLTLSLIPHLPPIASGKMVTALRESGFTVDCSDIADEKAPGANAARRLPPRSRDEPE